MGPLQVKIKFRLLMLSDSSIASTDGKFEGYLPTENSAQLIIRNWLNVANARHANHIRGLIQNSYRNGLDD